MIQMKKKSFIRIKINRMIILKLFMSKINNGERLWKNGFKRVKLIRNLSFLLTSKPTVHSFQTFKTT